MRKLVVVLLALAVGAACGSNDGGSSGGSASGSGERVDVTTTEYKFSPASLTVPAGETTFVVKNDGTEEHEFEIFEGDKLVDEVEGITPGLTRELTVDLKAGQYTYVCKQPGHEEAGMKGTLTVS